MEDGLIIGHVQEFQLSGIPRQHQHLSFSLLTVHAAYFREYNIEVASLLLLILLVRQIHHYYLQYLTANTLCNNCYLLLLLNINQYYHFSFSQLVSSRQASFY